VTHDPANPRATLAPDGTPAYETRTGSLRALACISCPTTNDRDVLRAGSGLFFDTGGAATGLPSVVQLKLFANPAFPIR
jgi:hypothetical protein